ncbi:small ribosomal subunit protein eS4-like isoform X2 [Haliotis cracherodii]|uniref:small ribosomal subunit protein eS4-like isoform X2 n=1 Tax=Haliotis cracherodii TaxID=6455 RepID=UPI0039E7ECC2
MGYRGRRKVLKRVTAPKSWMLDKLGGVFAPRPSTGPHKLREALPMSVLMRNRLKYALTYNEVKKIVNQRLIKVDGRVRTDKNFPTGFMDVVTIEKTSENFRVLYDVKGRFIVHRIKPEEAKYKLCRVRGVATGPKGVPYLTTNDGRTIRYPDPVVKVNDTIMVDIATGKMKDYVKFESGFEQELQPVHDHWRPQLGTCWCNNQQGKASRVFRHCSCQGFPWTHICHKNELCVCDWQGQQAMDLPTKRQRSEVVHCRGT